MSALAIHPASVQTDEELITAFRGGDERAAAHLVQRHASDLARYLYGLGAPVADVDDLTQEAFYRAFRAAGSFRGESSFKAWLFRIGANAARDHHRRTRKRVVLSLEGQDLVAEADPAGEAEAGEARDRLLGALKRLPPKQRDVFLLRAQQGLSYEEIAGSLGTTPGAARVHYHHAVKRLKEAMA
jgi:RNA polymerase sigma-70 factor (ECF subfamily)